MIVIRTGDYPLWYFPDIMQPQMGEVRHITIQCGFALAATEMTQREYARLTGNPASESEYPQEFTAVLPAPPDVVSAGDRLSLIETCRRANLRENLTDECFDPDPAEGVAAYCNLRKRGFRFPVAQEWLVCCTAGSLTPRYFGSDRTDGAGFIGDTPKHACHSVYDFFPNRLGFFDMTDNLLDLTLTQFDVDRELLLGPAAGDVVLRAGDNLTYHGGKNWLPNDAKMTLYTGGAHLGSQILMTCLRLAQTLPGDTFSEKED